MDDATITTEEPDNPVLSDDERLQQERLARKERLLKRQEEARKRRLQAEKEDVKINNEKEEEEEEGSEEGGDEGRKAELREDMVKNAVIFLSNPEVRRTPLSRRVEFLKSKGVTQDEIDEALSRVEEDVPKETKKRKRRIVYEDDEDEEEEEIVYRRRPTSNQRTMDRRQMPMQPVQQSQQYQPQQPQQPQTNQQLNQPTTSMAWSTIFKTVVATLSIAGGAIVVVNKFFPQLFGKEANKSTVQSKVIEEPTIKEQTNAFFEALEEEPESGASNQEIQEIKEICSTVAKQLQQSLENQETLSNKVHELQQIVSPLASPAPRSNQSMFTPSTVNSQPNFHTPKQADSMPNNISSYTPEEANKSKSSYVDIVNMVKRGEMPDDIKQIDDAPLNPNAAIPAGAKSAPKPWLTRRKERKGRVNQEFTPEKEKLPSFLQSQQSQSPQSSQSSQPSQPSQSPQPSQQQSQVQSPQSQAQNTNSFPIESATAVECETPILGNDAFSQVRIEDVTNVDDSTLETNSKIEVIESDDTPLTSEKQEKEEEE